MIYSKAPMPKRDIEHIQLLKTIYQTKGIEALNEYLETKGTEPMTLAQIGEVLGVTRERARQILDKAIKKLRHPTFSRELRKIDIEEVADKGYSSDGDYNEDNIF